MGIYKKRVDGEQVQTFTCRISTELYSEVKEYAYSERVSLSLALEDLISKGFRFNRLEDENNKNI